MEKECPDCGAALAQKTNLETAEAMEHCNECGYEGKTADPNAD